MWRPLPRRPLLARGSEAMADTVQIKIGVDAGDALDQIKALTSGLSGLTAPLAAIGDASGEAAQLQQRMTQDMISQALQATRVMQQLQGSYTAAFKNGMQVLVDSKQITVQQALGFDIDYTAQVFTQEQERLAAIRDNDAAAVDDRRSAVAEMQQLDARYIAQSSEDYRRLADAARSQADQVARSYEQAFERAGTSVQRTLNDILTGQTSWAKGMTRMVQDVETFFLEQVETMAARWAASGLASLAGGAVSSAVGAAQATGASGLAAGLTALLGVNQPGGLLGTGLFSGAGSAAASAEAAAVAANTTALATSTAAVAALTAALGGATAAESAGAGASLAGGASAAAAGGSLFGWLGSLFSFDRGGIVPSAAGGWALPNFAGATPALLHAREMVLPADLSQGLQGMIAAGGAGTAHFHAHFHGPADAPAISRWFRDNLKSNAGAVRDLFRQNALTPRSL
jgi:hypothetical protein